MSQSAYRVGVMLPKTFRTALTKGTSRKCCDRPQPCCAAKACRPTKRTSIRAVHRSNIKPVLCKPEKVFWQVCSRFPLEHLWHVWLLLFGNLVLSPLFAALLALGLGWQGGFSVASGAQASLFGLLSYFSLSAVILLPPAFKTHARNGPSYWGWPLS